MECTSKARRAAQNIRDLARTIDAPPHRRHRSASRSTPALSPQPYTGARSGFRKPSQLPSGACFLSHAQPPLPPSSGTRDSLPSAEAALEDARYRFALRPQTVDEKKALACWPLPPMIPRGVGTGTCQRVKTRLQLSATLIPEVPRPVLRRPHYTPGCGAYPKGGIDKDMAASAFVS
ncbi:hypothetical protein N7494_008392 [Penicillium frequentans]|uniref:Uncharacterized protein n=1 Tax=Penicillium frequentans TaxID=3151616 RepID=A0AAD6CUM3_9EURO|nr:hypothetical protein N7494_008392 [Penicillium glabrum]